MSFTESNAPMAPAVNANNDFNAVHTYFTPADARMAPESSDSSAVPTWSSFKNFQVFSASGGHTLYANGYQQLKLIVLVQAADDAGVVVDISAAELDNVQLFDAYSGHALPLDHIRDSEPAAWKCVLEPRGAFLPFPYSGELQGPVTRGKSVFLKEFYVSSNSPHPIKLIAAITRSDGQIFYSDERSEYGHVYLKTVPSPTYRKEHYRLRKSSSHSIVNEDVAKIDHYVLDLLVDQQLIKFVKCNVSGLLRLRSDHPDYLGYYAVTYFHGRKAHLGHTVLLEALDSFASANDEPGKVALIIHYAKKGGRSQIRSDRQSVRLYLQDIYGNEHEINVKMACDSSPTLEIV